MTWGLLNAAMLVGLFGAAVPVVIHLLNRRRDPVVDWGAMQFLELGRKARQKLRLTELLLMLARLALLVVVALARARPYRGDPIAGSELDDQRVRCWDAAAGAGVGAGRTRRCVGDGAGRSGSGRAGQR